MGMGPMTGGGRGFCATPLRRTWPAYTYPYYRAYGFRPFAPRISRESELEFLKSEAAALRQDLKVLEDRIGKMSTPGE
jgi:hypothetical protein